MGERKRKEPAEKVCDEYRRGSGICGRGSQSLGGKVKGDEHDQEGKGKIEMQIEEKKGEKTGGRAA